MVLFILVFSLSIIGLIKGADFLVNGAASIAKQRGVSSLVIGLTVVSFGTSVPELVVNIQASIAGSGQIAVGNILGSNIANILLVLGMSAVIVNLPVQKSTLFSEIPFSLTAILLLVFLATLSLSEADAAHTISRLDGGVLLFFFILFMAYIRSISKDEPDMDIEIATLSSSKSIGLIIGGILLLIAGGKGCVWSATNIATAAGMSERFIGLTVVAVGTSLPELFTSVKAALKKQVDIAIGNVIGSNIFNILWILGVSALINPLPFSEGSMIDSMVIVIASAFILFAMTLGRKSILKRWTGILFLLGYVAYIIYLLL